jgi:peptide/nickel transport system permease protein
VLAYVVRRLVQAAVTMLGVTLLVFLSLHIAPGDPAVLIAGDEASQEDLQRIRVYYGLDRPLPVQYLSWAWGIVHGNFGTSHRGGAPVGPDLLAAFRVTLILSLGALALAAVVGIPIGLLAGTRRDGPFDLAVMGLSILGMSMPVFWVALVMVLAFSLRLGWLPSAGWGTFKHFIMPCLALSLTSLALIARMTRATVVEVLLEDYVRTARAKGLAQLVLLLKHAFPNALPPVVTIIGLRFGLLVGGAVITETVFAVPGLGRLVIQGVSQRDFPVVQSGVLVIALMVGVISLLVDLSLSIMDPRIRYA